MKEDGPIFSAFHNRSCIHQSCRIHENKDKPKSIMRGVVSFTGAAEETPIVFDSRRGKWKRWLDNYMGPNNSRPG